MQDAFPIRAGGPGWFSYRPGYSSAGQGRLMRMESTAILRGGISWVLGRTFIGKIFTVCRRRIPQSFNPRWRSGFGSGLGIFIVDAPRRLLAGRLHGCLAPVARHMLPRRKKHRLYRNIHPGRRFLFAPGRLPGGVRLRPGPGDSSRPKPFSPLLAPQEFFSKLRHLPERGSALSHAYCSCDPRKSRSQSR